MQATNYCNLPRNNIIALEIEERCYTYYHPPQTLSRNKISLLQVEAACCSKLKTTFFNKYFNLQQQCLVA